MYANLDDFVVSKTASGLSVRTVDWYAASVRRYSEWTEIMSAPKEKPETVEGYLAHLRTDGRSAFYIAGCYRALSVFFKWMVERRGLYVSPMAVISPPQTPVKRVTHITAGQFNRLYDSIPVDHWWELRDRAILLILFYSGLRASELLSLRLDSIDRDRCLLLVGAGKGDKDRDVPCADEVIAQLDLYLSQRPAFDSQALFLACARGRQSSRGPLAYDGLKEMLRRRCKAAGITHFSAHKFRHAYAMIFANAGMPLSALSASMGHSSVSVTERFYARWQTKPLSAAYNQAFQKMTHEENHKHTDS